MRTRLYIVVGLVLAIVLLLIVILIPKHSAAANPCPQFLTLIQQNNAKDSYKMLTKEARTLQTADQWTSTVKMLHGEYGKVQPLAHSNNVAPSPTANDNLTENYDFNNQGTTYTAACFLTRNGSSYQISAFSSYSNESEQ